MSFKRVMMLSVLFCKLSCKYKVKRLQASKIFLEKLFEVHERSWGIKMRYFLLHVDDYNVYIKRSAPSQNVSSALLRFFQKTNFLTPHLHFTHAYTAFTFYIYTQTIK